MEGEPHFEFKKTRRTGCCPVRFCRRKSRAQSAGRKPSMHRLCSTHCNRAWRLNHPVADAYRNSRHHAKQRGIVWSLTLEQFIEFVEGNSYIDGKGCQKHSLHIDRKDATLGYAVGNLQVLTCTDNVAKGNQERRNKYVQDKIDAAEADPF
jgi:hypothetical protein